MKTDKQQIKKLAPKVTMWYLVGLIIIPLVIILIGITINQFGPAEIHGKGGYERSISHPFICRGGPMTGPTREGYCGYFAFLDNIFTYVWYQIAFISLIWEYIKFSWITLPIISIFIYYKDRKKFVKSANNE